MGFRTSYLVIVAMLAGCAMQASSLRQSQQHGISFPTDSHAVLRPLGNSLFINCRSNSSAVMAECRKVLEQRMHSCLGDSFVIPSRAQYEIEANRYLACVAPHPICAGVEVKDDRNVRSLCGTAVY